jgi:hypothetical protein
VTNDERTNDDDATDRQREAGLRRGEIIPGKGFDAGTGYGGAGSDSAYRGESSYGGQSGSGGDTLGGAYQGDRYGRSDVPNDEAESATEFDPDAPLGGERREPGR